MRKLIFSVLVIWMALNIAPIAAQEGVTYYVNVRAAKVRAEPKSTAKLITTLARGKTVIVLEVVAGELVGHVDTWYRIKVNGKDGYVLSSLLTDRAPASATSTKPTTNSTPATKTPTAEPVSVIPPAPSNASCNGATKCSQMTSCEQAYACMNAGNGRLDGDKDGVPCESICSGG